MTRKSLASSNLAASATLLIYCRYIILDIYMNRIRFGGIAGRSLGGVNSWKNRLRRPGYYRNLGCNLPNVFSFPSKDDVYLAEFIGIVLGDGGITSSQLRITLNRIADKQYVEYVSLLVERLFGYKPSRMERKDASATVLSVCGVDFIRYLHKIGLLTGNKVRQQVNVPSWISTDAVLSLPESSSMR